MTHLSRDRATGTGATYVFAVCRGTRAVNTGDVTGLAGMPGGAAIRLLSSGPLTAVVQTVLAADFTDEVWQERLSDRQGIEAYARAHHEVVSAAAAHGPAVPLPLATLYHDDDRVRRALDDEAHRFHSVLKRIAHHAEWGVKVYKPDASSAPEEREPAPSGSIVREGNATGAGLAYLNRRRGVRERREQALSVAESVDAELRALAAASRRLRTHGVVPGGEGRAHVLNATYLVAEQRATELESLVRALGERTGTRIELTGPWVPYSFVGEG
ncbi:Gas vesicle synthesis protein GvpL/GvpF [Streptomyces sp. MnatMP-M77]|uniref:GvpL/GvpF family gas vesicle protein n=1 Tax=unclassified Streptomyces TaxID=2593676 RepID=UPI0008056FEC|nr:GvpL/GvpF family gas vesicle protein [Streptomyces sp. MnatMP-M77]MYT82422.1 gas vesicle protein [Streptomyces sp. SID8364]SBU96585.1 Gas vesicle synthesis protein GvpL/GvpF [Streptomyces sp. MnatMP-M77]